MDFERQEQIFRWTLLVGILVVIPMLRFHRFRARQSGDKLDRRAEGLPILLTLRPFGIMAFLSLVLFVINPAWMSWSQVAIPSWLRWLGLFGAGLAASLLCLVLIHLGDNLTDTVVTRANHRLVTTGPYRWVRHPFYSAIGLGLVSNALVTANWFLGLTGLITFVLIVIRTRVEEERLLERFGKQYEVYMQQTGRFVPRVAFLSPAPSLAAKP